MRRLAMLSRIADRRRSRQSRWRDLNSASDARTPGCVRPGSPAAVCRRFRAGSAGARRFRIFRASRGTRPAAARCGRDIQLRHWRLSAARFDPGRPNSSTTPKLPCGDVSNSTDSGLVPQLAVNVAAAADLIQLLARRELPSAGVGIVCVRNCTSCVVSAVRPRNEMCCTCPCASNM